MDTEIDRIVEGLPGGAEAMHEGVGFYETRCEALRVIVSRTGVGMLNAAVAICTAIERYRPDYVLNQGTAGGHTCLMNPGDPVLG